MSDVITVEHDDDGARQESAVSAPQGYDAIRLAEEFGHLHDVLYTTGDPDDALHRLVVLAEEALPSCLAASISSWREGRPPVIVASSDDTATLVNAIQHEQGAGPCMTAASARQVVRLQDLEQDGPWPGFAREVVRVTPVRSMVSFHLVDRPVPSALSLFGESAGAFDDDAFDMASLFAGHARVVLAHAASTRRAGNLTRALETSRTIGTAVGVLMQAHKVPEPEAFLLLRRASERLNTKVASLAADVTYTGRLPGRSAPPP